MKIRLKEFSDKDKQFFVFVGAVVALLVLISGINFVSACFTGLFVYIFLVICHFVWEFLRRVLPTRETYE